MSTALTAIYYDHLRAILVDGALYTYAGMREFHSEWRTPTGGRVWTVGPRAQAAGANVLSICPYDPTAPSTTLIRVYA